MALTNWRTWLRSLSTSARRRPLPERRRPRVRPPYVEQLEVRLSPATDIWNGGAGLGNYVWSNAANWSLGRAPLTGDDLVFPANAPTTSWVNTNDLTPGTEFNSISIATPSTAATGYQLSGSQVTLGNPAGGGNLVVGTLSKGEAISFDIQMGGVATNRQSFNVGFAGDLTFSGHLSGNTGVNLSKDGTGLLVFTSDNSAFTGPITVDAGVLEITNANALGDQSSGTTVEANAQLAVSNVSGPIPEALTINGPGPINDGALLNVAGNNTWAGTVTLDSDSTLGSNAGALNISGQITDFGQGHNLTKEGVGQILFSHVGGNAYRGQTIINNGILTIEDPLSLGPDASGGGGTLATGTIVNQSVTETGTLQLLDPNYVTDGGGFTVKDEVLVLNGTGVNGPNVTGFFGSTNIGAVNNVLGANTWAGTVMLGSDPPNGSDVSMGVSDALIPGAPSTLTISGVITDAAGIPIAAAPGGASEVGATVTIKTTFPHNLAAGSRVHITGLPAGYDGVFTISSVPTSTTFTYTDTVTGLAASGGGAALPVFNLFKVDDGELIFNNANTYSGTTFVLMGNLTIRDSQALGYVGDASGGGTVVEVGASLNLAVDTGFDAHGRDLTNDSVTGVSAAIAATPGGATESGSTVTITTTTPHGFAAGQQVSVSGIGVPGYNGIFVITSVPTPTTFTYTDANLGLANSGSGMAVVSANGPQFGLTVSELLALNGTGFHNTGALHSISGINKYEGTISLQDFSDDAAIGVEPDPNASANNSYFTHDYSLTVDSVIRDDPGDIGFGGVLTVVTQSVRGSFPTLNKNDGGQLILTGANTYQGNTFINQGWVTVRNAQALGVGVPGQGDTVQPYIYVHSGAALHLMPDLAGNSYDLHKNLILSGRGITHPFDLIGGKGALMNLGGANTVSGTIQLYNTAGIGVELLNPFLQSDLSLTGAISDFQSFTVPVPPLRNVGEPILQENANIIDMGTTSATVVITYNMFTLTDDLRLYYPPRYAAGSTRVFDTGQVAGTGTTTQHVGGTSNLIEIVVNEGGNINATKEFPPWDYTATITPDNAGPGGIIKYGSQRLHLQGPGTYTGSVEVAEGILVDQNDTGLGRQTSGTAATGTETFATTTTTVDPGAALELSNTVASLNGGISAGIQVWDEQLTLNSPGATSIQTVQVTVPSGTFSLSFNGQSTPTSGPGALPFNATAAQVQAALMTLSTVGGVPGGFVTVVPAGPGAYTVVFQGTLVAFPPVMLGTGATVSGPEAPLVNVSGDNMWRGPATLVQNTTVDVTPNSRLTLFGSINDAPNLGLTGSDLTKLDTGELVLGGSNSYRGVTHIGLATAFGDASNQPGGILTIENSDALGATGPTSGAANVALGATLQLQGNLTVGAKRLNVEGTGLGAAPTSVPLRWFNTGPGPSNNGQQPGNQAVSGRVTGVAADPTDPNVIYIATAGGGAWKTTDAGRTWQQLFDSTPVQTIRLPGTTGTFTLSFNGATTGILDLASPTLTADIRTALDKLPTIGGLSPVPGVVVVTQSKTDRLLYVVTFGGSLSTVDVPLITGKELTPVVDATAVRVLGQPSPLFAGAIAIDPNDPRIVYLGTGEANNSADSYYGSGVYRSTDSGLTWTLLTDNSGGNPLYGLAVSKIVVDPGAPGGGYAPAGTSIPGKQFLGVDFPTDQGTYPDTPLTANSSTLGIMPLQPPTGIIYVATSDQAANNPTFPPPTPTFTPPGLPTLTGPTGGVATLTAPAATVGQFTLSFGGATTSQLDLSSTNLGLDIQNALDGLSSIGGAGGFVTVAPLGSGPGTFTITFGGALAGTTGKLSDLGSIPGVYRFNTASTQVQTLTVPYLSGPGTFSLTFSYIGNPFYAPYDGLANILPATATVTESLGLSGAALAAKLTTDLNAALVFDNGAPPGPFLRTVTGAVTVTQSPLDPLQFTIVIGGGLASQPTPDPINQTSFPNWGVLPLNPPLMAVSAAGTTGGAVPVISASDTWNNLTLTPTTARLTLNGQLPAPPGTPGPNDDYRLNFPTAGAVWSDLTLAYFDNTTPPTGSTPTPSVFLPYPNNIIGEDPAVPVLYAALGIPGGSLNNAVYRTEDPGLAPNTASATTWFVGDPGVPQNEIQTITISPYFPNQGDYQLCFNFVCTPAPPPPLPDKALNTQSTAMEISTALNALSTIGGVGGCVTVTAGPQTATSITYIVTWGCAMQFTKQNLLTATTSNKNFTVTIAETQAGTGVDARSNEFPVGDFTTGIPRNGNIKITSFVSVNPIATPAVPPLPGPLNPTFAQVTLYAAVTIPEDTLNYPTTHGETLEIDKTVGGGKTWVQVPVTLPNYMGVNTPTTHAMGWYDSTILMTNPNTVFVGGEQSPGTPPLGNVLESTDGGNTWTNISVGADGTGPHTGEHALWQNSAGQILIGSDGGIWRLDNATPGSIAWTDINGNLADSLINGAAVAADDPRSAVVGTQGNGVSVFTGEPAWLRTDVASGDGGRIQFDPKNPNIVYAVHVLNGNGLPNQTVSVNSTLDKSIDGGQTWTPTNLAPFDGTYFPFVVDSVNDNRLLAANDVFSPTGPLAESLDGGVSFHTLNNPLFVVTAVAGATYQGNFRPDTGFSLVNDVGAATYDPNTIYSFGFDAAGFPHLEVTKNRGQSWQDRLPTAPGISTVTSIEVNPNNRDNAFLVANVFGAPHILETINAGQTWTDVTFNLPDLPTWTVVVDPRTNDVYVGNDQGVYRLPGGSTTWTRFGYGMPNVPVHDMVLNQALDTVTAGTYGRSMFQFFLSDVSGGGAPQYGAVRASSGSSVWTGPVFLAGPTAFGAGGTQAVPDGVSAATLNILGSIGDLTPGANNPVTKVGPGTVIFSGANTYSGITDVQQGLLVANNPLALGASNLDSVQTVTVTGTAGTFTVTFQGQQTVALPFNVPASGGTLPTDSLQNALNALSSVSAVGSVTVTQSGNVYTIVFGGGFTGFDQTPVTAAGTGGATAVAAVVQRGGIVSNVQTLTVTGSSGTFRVTFNGQQTAPLAFNIPASGGTLPTDSLQNALNALSSIGGAGGAVTVYQTGNVYTVIFGGSFAGFDQNPMTATAAGGDTAIPATVTHGTGGTMVESGAALGLQSDIELEPLHLFGDGLVGTAHFTSVGAAVPVIDHFTGALRNISNTNTYTGLVTLETAGTIGADSGSTLTIGTSPSFPGTGSVSAAATFGLTKESTGTLVLSTANTNLLSTVTVRQGALRITDPLALGSTAAGTTVQDAGQLQIQGGITVVDEPLTLSGTGIFNSGALLNTGGNNTWAGPIVLTSITVDLPPQTTGSPSVYIGVTNSFDTLTIGDPKLPFTITEAPVPGFPTFGITKVGNGKVVLPRADNYNGITTVSAGILNIQTPAALGTLGDFSKGHGTIVNSGGTLQLDLSPGNPSAVTPQILNESLQLNGSGSAGIGALDNVSGVNTWAGTVGVGGTITLVTSAAIGVEAGGGSLTVTGNIAGTAAAQLGKVGLGTLFLPTANTYLGPTQVQAGILNISFSDPVKGQTSLGPAGSMGTTVAAGATLQLSDGSIGPITVASEPLTLNGNGSTGSNGALENVSGNNTWSDTVTLNTDSTIGVDGSTILTIGNPLLVATITQGTTNSNLTKVGTGTLVLSTNNNYGGTTFVNQGYVQIQAQLSLGLTTNGTVVANGAELDVAPAAATTFAEPLTLNGSGVAPGNLGALYNFSGNNTWTAPITLNTTSVIGVNSATMLAATGVISQASTPAGLTKEGAGTLVLGGTNLYDGVTLIDKGIVILTNPQGLGTTVGGTIVMSGAALQLQLANAAVTGEALTLNGTGFNPANGGALENLLGNNTWAGPITLGSNSSIGADPGTSLTVNGSIGDSGSGFNLTKLGTGTLVLAKADTYGGITFINQGILTIQDPNALGTADGTAATGTVVANLAALQVQLTNGTVVNEALTLNGAGFNSPPALASGALRDIGGNTTWTGPITLQTNSSVGADTGAVLTLTGVISDSSGSQKLNKEGLGTVVLGGLAPNTYGGVTTVDAGILQVAKPGALGSALNGTVVVNGAELDLAASVTDGEALTLNGSGISNAGALHNIGADHTWSGPVILQTNSAIGVDAGTNLKLLSPITQTAASNLNKEGPGRLILTQPTAPGNGFTGIATVDGGALQITNPAALNSSSGIIVNAGAALELNFSNSGTVNMPGKPLILNGNGINNGGALRDVSGNANQDVWLAGPVSLNSASAIGVDINTQLAVSSGISGAPSATLSKVGLGTLLLNTANSYQGNTLVQAGTLAVSNASALGVAPPLGGTVTVQDGASLELLGNGITYTKPLTLGGAGFNNLGALIGGPAALGGNNTWAGPITLQDDTTVGAVGGSDTLTLSGVISEAGGSRALTVVGLGTVVVTGTVSNAYTGLTTVRTGTLFLDKTGGALGIPGNLTVGYGSPSSTAIAREGVNDQVPDTATVLVNSDGIFDLNNNTDTVGPVIVKGGTVTTGILPAPFGGGLTASSLTMTGGNVTAAGTIGNPPSYITVTGNVTMTGGTLTANGIGSPITVDGTLTETDGFINLSGKNTTLTLGSTLNMTGGAINMTGANSQTTLGGDVTATSDSTTASARILGGTLNLAAPRNFNVSAGTAPLDLIVSAVISGPDAVTKNGSGAMELTATNTYTGLTTENAGSLYVDGPSGRIGDVSLIGGLLGGTGTVGAIAAVGGTIRPGDNPGILTSAGGTTMTSAVTFTADIDGPTPGNASNDYSQLQVIGPVSLGNATLAANVGGGYVPAAVGTVPTFTIIQSTGTLTGQFAQGTTAFLSGMKFIVAYTAHTVTLTREKANTTTVITASSPVSPSNFGQMVTFTATVTPEAGATFGAPTGTVTFKDGSTTLGTGTLSTSAGVTTATYTTFVDQLMGGSHSITATYDASADPSFNGSATSAAFPFTVNPAATTTTIIAATPASPSTFGTAVTFTATVTPTVGATEPHGTVTFKDGSSNLGTVNLDNSGPTATATITTAVDALIGGTHTITAVYTPSGTETNFVGSTSANFSYTVNAHTTTTTITGESPPSPSTFGTAVTFTATVTPKLGATEPTGTVAFLDNGTTVLGTVTLADSGGVATATYTTVVDQLTGGTTHNITAVYTPASTDTNFQGSTSVAVPYTVNPSGTTTTIVSTLPSGQSTFGDKVTITVQVTPTFNVTVPTGTVAFLSDGIQIGTGTLAKAGGIATATYTTFVDQLTGGSHNLTATYTPLASDHNYLGSTSAVVSYDVNALATTTTITAAAPAGGSTFGQQVMFTATVTPTVGATEPTGTVGFFDGTHFLGTGTLANVSGTATTSITTAATALSGGAHAIHAVYTPAVTDKNFQGSTSANFAYTVSTAATTTNITGETPSSPSSFGTAVTFTATVTPAIGGVEPTGTVEFLDGTNVLGSTALVNSGGTATATFTTGKTQLTGGSHSITAVYVPGTDPNYQASASTVVTYLVNTAGTTTTITGETPSGGSTFGQQVTFTATVTPSINLVDPTGTVKFFDGTTLLGSGTLADVGGVATTSYTTAVDQLLGGSHSITAVYVPGTDPNYQSSTSTVLGYTVSAAGTTTTIAGASPSSPQFGQQVTLTAVVAPTVGAVEPSGTVAFYDGGTTLLGTGTLGNVGNKATATYTTTITQLAVGNHTLTAVYTPAGTDHNFLGSTSANFSLAVARATTTTTITGETPSAASTFGTAVTFTATVTPTIGGIDPLGTVTFLDGTTTLGSGTVTDVGGVGTATFTTGITQLLGGSHLITAVFTPSAGDPSYATSTSAAISYTVNTATTTTTIVGATPSPSSTFGQGVTFTAVVAPTINGVEATGTVAFKEGSTVLGFGNLGDVGGKATATFMTTITQLTGGTHSIVAVYTPAASDHNFAASTSAAFSYTVNAAPTATGLTATPATQSTFGQQITFSATVTPTIKGVEPTGTVRFLDGTTLLGTGNLADSGGIAVASYTTPVGQVPGGSHVFTAVYVPGSDLNFQTSTSAGLTYTVHAHTSTTTVTAASPASPSTFGDQVTFTATVAPTLNGVEPTGTVQFFDGTTLLGNGTLADSSGLATATYMTTSDQLVGGTHTITASYVPGTDPNFLTSTSASFPFVVGPSQTLTTVTSAAPTSPSVFGTAVKFTATVAPTVGAFEPTGTVNFFDGTTLLGSGTLGDVSGTATATISTTATQLKGGIHAITATYVPVGGDLNFVGSTSGAFDYTVSAAATTTTITQELPASPKFGQPVTFTATVAPTIAGVEPTGTVSFLDAGNAIGVGSLSDVGGLATATFTTGATQLTVGSHGITATYNPAASDTNFLMSFSNNFALTVARATSTTTLTQTTPVSPSNFGQPVTFTVTVTPSFGAVEPTGSVQFKDGATVLGTGALAPSGGLATATFTTAATQLAVGGHTITAVYVPGADPNYTPSSSAGTPFTVNPSPSATTVTAATPASPSTFGQAVTFTATVTPSFGSVEPTGQVTFMDGSTVLGSGPLADAGGTATATFTTTAAQLAGGTHTITAVYNPSGDPNYLTSTSGSFTFVVNAAATTTAITQATPASPSTFGQSVTFTATVAPTLGGVEPTGTLTFMDGGTTLGTVALKDVGGTATATFSTTATQLTGGSHSVSAVYTPAVTDTNFKSSTSAAFAYTVNRLGTTTAIVGATPATPATFGTAVSFTATVTPSVNGTEPHGSVSFFDGTTLLGSAPLANAAGVATAVFTTAVDQLTVGGHSVNAVYTPAANDPNFQASTSANFSYTVNRAGTTTTVTAATPAGPSTFGTQVTFTATVTPTVGATLPTGTVTFKDGALTLGSGTLVNAGNVATATFTTAVGQLTGGTHNISAAYVPGGDPNFQGSTSGNFTYTVNAAATTTAITQATPVSPSAFGQAVTFTATVTPAIGGVEPTGAITFMDGTNFLGTGTLKDANGTATATFTTSAAQLAVGSHNITAVYGPGSDRNYQPSTSAAIGYTVNKAGTTTTVTAASPASPSSFGQAVTFTATVTPSFGTTEPTGTVRFLDNGIALVGNPPSLSNSGGVATATFTTTTTALTVGSHNITALYVPGTDPNFQGSTSGNFTYTVNGASTTTAITGDTPPAPSFGQPVTFTAVVTSTVGGTEPDGTVTFMDGTTTLGSGSLGNVGGKATATFTTTATQLAAGNHSVIAVYSPAGDPNFQGSTSPAFGVNVSLVGVTVTLTTTASSGVFGQPVITATVTPTNAGAGNPPGTVTFHVSGTTTMDVTDPLVGNTATLSPPLNAGTYTITATYSGGTNFSSGSPSQSIGQSIAPAGTSLTLSTSPSGPVTFGQPVTITATVTTNPPGSGTPTGNVTFTVDGTPVTRPLDNGGHATLTTVLGGGSHNVTASYGGGNDFVSSNASAPIQTTIVQAGSSTTLTVSSATFFTGQSVTLTASVTGLPPGIGAATGSVTFFDGGVALGTAPVVGGQATLVTSGLGVGAHGLRAVYSGNANFAGSEGDTAATNLGPAITVSVTRVHGRPVVKVFNTADHSLRFSFQPYSKKFKGPVRVVVADVNGDGFPDVVVAPGHGPAEPVLTFDGRTGAPIGRIAVAPHAFARGLYVAAGDINGDGRAEVIVGVGTEIRGYDGVSGAQLFRFAPFGKHSTRVVRVAALDVNHDGVAEFFAVAGTQVNGYDGRTLAPIPSAEFGPFIGQIMGQAAP
jgi:autotransporter-associated beta strand protein